MNNARRVSIIVAKLAISVALLWYAFHTIDTETAYRLLRSIHPGFIAAAVGILVLQQIAAGLRLHRLLGLVQSPISLATAVDAVFVGAFFGQTFVSFIGGDAMRIWRIGKSGVPLSSAFKAVLCDRVSGFVALIVLIALGLPMLFDIAIDPAMRLSILVALLLGTLGMLAFLLMNRLQRAFPRWRLLRTITDTSSLALSISSRPADISFLLGVSLLMQMMNVAAIFAIARGLGLEIRVVELLVLVPPVLLLSMLPISFAGWGVREGAMVVALGLVGVGAGQSVALSVCFGLCLIVVGLPGGLIWFIMRRNPGAMRENPAASSPGSSAK